MQKMSTLGGFRQSWGGSSAGSYLTAGTIAVTATLAVVSPGAASWLMLVLALVVVAAFTAALSASKKLALVAVITLVVSGTLVYYFDLPEADWLPSIVTVALGSVCMGSMRGTLISSLSGPLQLLLAFLLLLMCVTLVLAPSIIHVLVGIKIYLPMWFAIPIILKITSLKELRAGFEKVFLLLPFAELPFCLHQHFFIAPMRRFSPYDSVDGTFGGTPMSGGANGTLVLFSVISILVVCEMAQCKRLRPLTALLIAAVSLVNIGLGDVKVVFVILPLALLVQNYDMIARRPAASLLVASLTAAAGYVLYAISSAYYWVWSDQYYVDAGGSRLGQFIAYFFDPNYVNPTTSYVSRGASLAFWWHYGTGDVMTMLFGNGAGSVRAASVMAVGSVATRFPGIDIASTALSQLLWESGVIGTTIYVSAIGGASIFLLRQARRQKSEEMRGLAKTLAAILVCVFPLLIYTRYFIDHPPEQLLLAFIFGTVCLFKKQAARQRALAPQLNWRQRAARRNSWALPRL